MAFRKHGALLAQRERECADLAANNSQPPKNFCPSQWDGLLCWKETAAGKTAVLPCPTFISKFATEEVAVRHCSLDGQWEKSLGGGWTDYSSCNGVDRGLRSVPFTSKSVSEIVESSTNWGVSTVVNQRAISEVVDDGIQFGVTAFSSPVPSKLQAAHEDFAEKGKLIYDYFHDVDIVRALVHCTSLILLLTAIVFWCVVWYNARFGHPYRCVSFTIALSFSLLYHVAGMISLLVYIPNGFGCQFMVTLKSYADTGMYTFFFLYVLLCIGVAMRRLESGIKFYFLIGIALLLPLVLVSATTSLRILIHPEKNCDLLDELSRHLWYDRATKCLLLFGAICILSVLIYWLFCFDNSMFKLNRDFMLIRHSSVTLMIMVCYCFFLELYQIVFLSNGADGEITSLDIAENGLVLTILMCSKGGAAAFLLCFFDLEIFNLIYTFPCCPDLNSAVIDQAWEKRIRSESKVKFFDDSSDENQASASDANLFDKEKDHVLPQAQNIQSYGTVSNTNDLDP